MKLKTILFEVSLLGLTSCLTPMINDSTRIIHRNRLAVEESTRKIEENRSLIEESSSLLDKVTQQ